MKKILFFALAAMLVVAFTMPAAAKTSLSVSGVAKSRGFYLSNPGAGNEDATATDAFLDMFYALHFVFSPGGPANFKATFEGLQKKWGGAYSPAEPHSYDTDWDMGTDASLRNDARWTEALITYYKQPIGYFQIGRSVDKIGSIGGGLGMSKVNANRTHDDKYYCDRFYWQNTWGKFTSKFFYEKTMEIDSPGGTVDDDYDIFWFKEHYDWKGGGVWFNFTFYNEQWKGPVYVQYKEKEYKVQFAAYQAFGPLTLGGYVTHYFGTQEGIPGMGWTDKDIKNYEWYFTAEYKAGPLLAGFLYTHKDGQDTSNDVTTHSATGSYFQPLYAMFGQYDGLMYDWLFSGVDNDGDGVDDASGIDFIYFWVDYQLMEKLIVHAAYGYALADETASYVDSALGHEIDFGLAYKLAKTLTLGLQFGYFMPLDGLEDLLGGTADNHIHLSGEIKLEF